MRPSARTHTAYIGWAYGDNLFFSTQPPAYSPRTNRSPSLSPSRPLLSPNHVLIHRVPPCCRASPTDRPTDRPLPSVRPLPAHTPVAHPFTVSDTSARTVPLRTVTGECCATAILSAQDDFLRMRSRLQGIVEDAGHCELNWIEYYWGGCEHLVRKH